MIGIVAHTLRLQINRGGNNLKQPRYNIPRCWKRFKSCLRIILLSALCIIHTTWAAVLYQHMQTLSAGRRPLCPHPSSSPTFLILICFFYGATLSDHLVFFRYMQWSKAWQVICRFTNYDLKRPHPFKSFCPSLRKTLLTQKKITVFIVDVVVIMVIAQKRRHIANFDLGSSKFNKVNP